MNKIPLTRPFFDSRELELVKEALDSGWVTQGPMVADFEQRFADIHKVKYAYAVNSCTSALHLAALAVGLGIGDEAIVPSFTWVTSANCVEYTGAKAVFVDIDINTFNIDPDKIEEAITPNTKAIVVIHLFGLSVQMDKIVAIANKYGLKIIEDAACAVGTSFDGMPVGGIGDIGCFSFHPRKIITTGEGGMVTTNSPDLAIALESLRNHGLRNESACHKASNPSNMAEVDRLGYNFRMSDIQGAIGVAQLEKLSFVLEERRSLSKRYNKALADCGDIILPTISSDKSSHTFQSYVIRLADGGVSRRNCIIEELAAAGIWTRPGTHAVHCLEFYKEKYGLEPENIPLSFLAQNTTITLPLFPGMTEREFDLTLKAFKVALARGRV